MGLGGGLFGVGGTPVLGNAPSTLPWGGLSRGTAGGVGRAIGPVPVTGPRGGADVGVAVRAGIELGVAVRGGTGAAVGSLLLGGVGAGRGIAGRSLVSWSIGPLLY
jgi:hypothetical protein